MNRVVTTLVLLLTVTATLPAEEGARLGRWSEAIEARWWSAHTDPAQWVEEAAAMSITLRQAQERHGLNKMVGNTHWMGWMLHARWLRLFPPDYETHPEFSRPEIQALFARLGQSAAIRSRFLTALVPEDDATAALAILCRIAEAHPEDLTGYTALAVAYAVVHDQPLPDAWPHSFVDPAKLAKGDSDPVERFAHYVSLNQAGALLHDLTRLRVRDLTFLVDSPLEFKELGYARQINLATPRRLSQLYTAVPYDRQRIASRNYQWGGSTYRLIDIGRQGGICMDQAFFVSQAGKAQGVPTLLFIGQGLSGEHAWVGFLDRDLSWELEVARFRGENYPIGQAYDPQTWERITDTELTALLQQQQHPSSSASSGSVSRGEKLIQWAALNLDNHLYPEILRRARQDLPRDPRPWRLQAKWLNQHPEVGEEDRLRFWQEWADHFEDNADLHVKGLLRVIALLETRGDQHQADRLRDEVLLRTRSKRFDLAIAIAAEPVFRHLQNREWEEAGDAFEQTMRRFRTKAGGHLYYNLVQPYVLTALQERRPELAELALRYLERDFEAVPGSVLDNEIQALIRRVRQ